jgi:hypothetical protein
MCNFASHLAGDQKNPPQSMHSPHLFTALPSPLLHRTPPPREEQSAVEYHHYPPHHQHTPYYPMNVWFPYINPYHFTNVPYGGLIMHAAVDEAYGVDYAAAMAHGYDRDYGAAIARAGVAAKRTLHIARIPPHVGEGEITSAIGSNCSVLNVR